MADSRCSAEPKIGSRSAVRSPGMGLPRGACRGAAPGAARTEPPGTRSGAGVGWCVVAPRVLSVRVTAAMGLVHAWSVPEGSCSIPAPPGTGTSATRLTPPGAGRTSHWRLSRSGHLPVPVPACISRYRCQPSPCIAPRSLLPESAPLGTGSSRAGADSCLSSLQGFLTRSEPPGSARFTPQSGGAQPDTGDWGAARGRRRCRGCRERGPFKATQTKPRRRATGQPQCIYVIAHAANSSPPGAQQGGGASVSPAPLPVGWGRREPRSPPQINVGDAHRHTGSAAVAWLCS